MSEKNFDDILEKNSEENQQSPLFSYKNSSGEEKMVHKEEIPQEPKEPKEPKSLFKFIKNVFVESEDYYDEEYVMASFDWTYNDYPLKRVK